MSSKAAIRHHNIPEELTVSRSTIITYLLPTDPEYNALLLQERLVSRQLTHIIHSHIYFDILLTTHTSIIIIPNLVVYYMLPDLTLMQW